MKAAVSGLHARAPAKIEFNVVHLLVDGTKSDYFQTKAIQLCGGNHISLS